MRSLLRNDSAGPRTVGGCQAKLTRQDMEEMIVMERLHLYNRLKPCGASTLRRHLRDLGLQGVPSVSAIGRILARRSLTNGRTGYYPGDYQ